MSTATTPVQERAVVPSKHLDTPYPLIDCDPHFRRVMSYARADDYFKGGIIAAIPPLGMLVFEKWQPSGVGKGGFAPIMRLNVAMGLFGGFIFLAQRSSQRFYGFRENIREQERDMREMVDKVKKGEPLYGKSELTPYMQGVAARNSRYSGVFLGVMPWFNFVNHDQHGVDTAKYYQQAEKELEEERLKLT